MASSEKRGGKREGAGRKPKAVTHAGAIKRAEKRCADALPARLETLEQIAKGDIPVFEDVFEPACLATVQTMEVVCDADGNEKTVKVCRLLYPEIAKNEPEKLVLVKRTVRKTAPDKGANEYLINRVMGTPTNKHEFSGLSDAELLEEAARLFGRNDSSEDSSGGLSE